MSNLDRYLHAATENTRRSYQSAIEHFEAHWGGRLPATKTKSPDICRIMPVCWRTIR